MPKFKPVGAILASPDYVLAGRPPKETMAPSMEGVMMRHIRSESDAARGMEVWPFILWLYDQIHRVLWATLLAGCLFFAVFVAPKIPARPAEQASIRALEIRAENSSHCSQLGMPWEHPQHHFCLRESEAFRSLIERRMAEDATGL